MLLYQLLLLLFVLPLAAASFGSKADKSSTILWQIFVWKFINRLSARQRRTMHCSKPQSLKARKQISLLRLCRVEIPKIVKIKATVAGISISMWSNKEKKKQIMISCHWQEKPNKGFVYALRNLCIEMFKNEQKFYDRQ